MLLSRAAHTSTHKPWSRAALQQTAQRKHLSRGLDTSRADACRTAEALTQVPDWIQHFQARRKKALTPRPTQRKLPFRNLPPIRRKEKPLPLWIPQAREWLGGRWQRGDGRTDEAAALMPVMRKMRPDDCLWHGLWRMELLWLGRGYPHFRLFWRSHLFGVVDIPVPWLKELVNAPVFHRVQEDMAAYLVLCGWTAAGTAFVVADAKTKTDESKKELPTLFVSS